MKLLHREDVIEAGYDLPNTGLCANIGQAELEELKFGGEWVLAQDETVVADGHEQRYLYMLVAGDVAISKKNDQGNSQQIATLGPGAAFGEMAFLGGGVASADVQALGECILWRFDHERMLEFIGEHGVAGGQLCLNVASILSGRLVEGNKKVLDMGKELQGSLAQLQQAASAGSQKDQALRQMQGKVNNMQNAFKGSEVKKSGSNWLAVAACTVALLSTLGLVGLLLSSDDSVELENASLKSTLKKMEADEEFFTSKKDQMESEISQLEKDGKSLALRNEELAEQMASSESRSMTQIQDLREKLGKTERELSQAKDDLVRAQPASSAQHSPTPSAPVIPAKSKVEEILAWASKNTTLVFPCEIQVSQKAITLQDKDKVASIPVAVGGRLRALSYYPSSKQFIVVAQPNSNKFLATLPITNSTFVEAVKPKYEKYAKGDGAGAGTQLANPLAPRPKPPTRLSSQLPTSGSSVPSKTGFSSTEGEPKVAKGRAKNPQKPENVLDQMPAKPAGGNVKKVDTSDHGANCVCKDCRVSKVGKGGSLFQFDP